MKPNFSTLITSLFVPNTDPEPCNVPLPNAPHAHPDITLPAGGVNLLFGQIAPRLLSEAIKRAVAVGYRPYNATVSAQFGQPLGSRVEFDALEKAAVLLLLLSRVSKEIAYDVHERLLGYLLAEGITPEIKYSPTAFELVGAFPDLLQRLLKEKPYHHLQGIGYTIPGVGYGPPSQMLYLRDLSAIRRIQTVHVGSEPVFRLPTPKELQALPATFNPFLDSPAPGNPERPSKPKRSVVSPSR